METNSAENWKTLRSSIGLLTEQAKKEFAEKEYLCHYLRQFLYTHDSISLLVSSSSTTSPHLADASALCRAQIDKLFYVSYLSVNYDENVLVLERDFFRKCVAERLSDRRMHTDSDEYSIDLQMLTAQGTALGLHERCIEAILKIKRGKLDKNDPLRQYLPISISDEIILKALPSELKLCLEQTWKPEQHTYSQFAHPMTPSVLLSHIATGVDPYFGPEVLEARKDSIVSTSYICSVLGITIASTIPSWNATMAPLLEIEWRRASTQCRLGRESWESFVKPAFDRLHIQT